MSQRVDSSVICRETKPLYIVLAAPHVSAEIVAEVESSPHGIDVRAIVDDADLLEGAIRGSTPDIVFIHQHLPNARGGLGTFIEDRYGVPCVLLVDERLRGIPDLLSVAKNPFPPGVVAESARSGFRDVAGWPPSPAELYVVARLVLGLERRSDATSYRSAAPQRAAGRIVGFRSGVDGVGTTEMAINTAALLSRAGVRTILVDMHISGASLHHKLRLQTAPNTTGLHALSDALLSRSGTVPREKIDRSSAPSEEPTPLDLSPYILSYPTAIEEREEVLDILLGIEDRAIVKRFGDDIIGALHLLDALRAEYDVAILDLGSQVSPAQIEIVAHLDDLVIVTTPVLAELELVAASHARLMKAAGVRAERCHVLVNFIDDPAHQVSLVEIATRLGQDDILGAVVADLPLVRRARAAGYPPPALEKGRTAFSSCFQRDMEQVVDRLFPGLLPSRSTDSPTGLRAVSARFLMRIRALFGEKPPRPQRERKPT